MSGAVPVVRGCGRRIAGGIYVECGMSAGGKPVEFFLMDPPTPLPQGLTIAPQGVSWVQRDDVWHLVDWVGSTHYPNVADFLEEVRRFGLSRRIPKGEPFERITMESRILLVHARAIVEPVEEYRPRDGAPFSCPKHIREHETTSTRCAGLWWEDIEGGEVVDEEVGICLRRMPSFTYGGKARREGLRPGYAAGFFASFPLSRLVVVRDTAAEAHVDAYEKAGRARLPVVVVDE